MINPTVFLKRADQLVKTKVNKKGFKPKHMLALDDNGDLILSIVINLKKKKFYRITLDSNSNPDVVFAQHKDEIDKLVKKYPVK